MFFVHNNNIINVHKNSIAALIDKSSNTWVYKKIHFIGQYDLLASYTDSHSKE